RLEIDGHAVGERTAAVHRNAEQLAHLAVRAVRADDVLAAQPPRRAARDIPYVDLDTRTVLPDVGDHMAIENLRAAFLGATPQDRFERRLRDEQAPARTHGLDALVEAADDVGELAAGEAVHGDDRAVREEFLLGAAPHLVLDPCEAKQLE